MKLAIATGALTILSVGAANAAIASYDFETAPIGAVSVASFAGALMPLGIIQSTLSGGVAGGDTGVSSHAGQWNAPVGMNTAIDYGFRSFGVNHGGSWELIFGGGGIDSFAFDYNETEDLGFQVTYYGLDFTTQLGAITIDPPATAYERCQYAETCSSVTITSGAAIGRIVLSDIGSDGFILDNLVVNTLPGDGVPEPSSYLLVGSALAGLAYLRRR